MPGNRPPGMLSARNVMLLASNVSAPNFLIHWSKWEHQPFVRLEVATSQRSDK
jgi:hypothetical protein